MKSIAIFLSLIVLSGCGLVKEQELQSDIKSAEQYCDFLMSDSELDPIRNKLPLNDIKKASFDMLANTQKATDAEKPVIRIYAMKETECQTRSMKALDKFGDESYGREPRLSASVMKQCNFNTLNNLAISTCLV